MKFQICTLIFPTFTEKVWKEISHEITYITESKEQRLFSDPYSPSALNLQKALSSQREAPQSEVTSV